MNDPKKMSSDTQTTTTTTTPNVDVSENISVLKIRGNAQIGQTLQRIGVLQTKGVLGEDKFKLQAVGTKAARIALVCAQNKGCIESFVIEPHTLPNDVETMRVTITVLTAPDSQDTDEASFPEFDHKWNVCAPREKQTMRTSCQALDKKLNNLDVGQTLKCSSAGRALETMIVFMFYLQQEYDEYCTVSHRHTDNVVLTNPNSGRANKITTMDVWITKTAEWSNPDGAEENTEEGGDNTADKNEVESIE